jgi:hypothetical protein
MARGNKTKNITRWVKRHQFKHLCKCGCEEFIPITRAHAKPSVGIPKYIKGHNLRPKLPLEEVEKEKESAWDKLSPEEQERRVSQLKSFKRGDKNPAWKGGRRIDENGYVRLLMPDHPFAKDGYVAEHRFNVENRTRKYYPDHPLLVEAEGEKYLSPKSVVHHIDEVKTNNDVGNGPNEIGNLMLLPNQAAHSFIHHSPLPMEERLRRIELGIFHSKHLDEE